MPLMMCPNCQTGMQEINRNSVQIDMCPQCRGVWLDRGELEKLMGGVRQMENELHQEREYYQKYSQHYDDDYHHKHKKHKKRFDIFDIFD